LVESVDAVIVVVEEEGADMDEVHGVAFGEGKCFSGEASDALPKSS